VKSGCGETILTPTTIRLTSTAADPSPFPASLHGLDGINFFLAGVLAGFGPYVAFYLADQKWTQDRIGFVLSASALAGLLSQVPGGELLDTIRSKRAIVALGVLVVALSAMIIEFQPTFPLVLIGLTLQGITGGVLGPAIAAISLGVVGHSALPERLGRNQRFAATGSLAAAALMGLIGYAFSIGRYSCWSSHSLCLCLLLSLESMQPIFTSVAPAALLITTRLILPREPGARACGIAQD
jgi:MFS family permease